MQAFKNIAILKNSTEKCFDLHVSLKEAMKVWEKRSRIDTKAKTSTLANRQHF